MRSVIAMFLLLASLISTAEETVTPTDSSPKPAINIDAMGKSVTPGSLRNDFLITEIKAKAGDPDAQLQLARLYIAGKGTRQIDRKANYWLDKAARQGAREAQIMLADRYYAGTGIPRPYFAHALKWYIAAGEQGDPHSQSMAGKMFYKGIGTKRDYKAAFKWLYQSAQRRDAESQHLVGVMYRFGHGMDKNYLNSYIWLHVAYVSTRDEKEKQNIAQQKERVGVLMDESELLGAKLLAPEYADMYAMKK